MESDCQWVSSRGNESVLDLDTDDGVPPRARTKPTERFISLYNGDAYGM